MDRLLVLLRKFGADSVIFRVRRIIVVHLGEKFGTLFDILPELLRVVREDISVPEIAKK